jgi:hypothetical protein
MSEIISLNQKRKEKARQENEKHAEHNRAKHGRTKAEKSKEKIKGEHARQHLEGHKLDNEDKE